MLNQILRGTASIVLSEKPSVERCCTPICCCRQPTAIHPPPRDTAIGTRSPQWTAPATKAAVLTRCWLTLLSRCREAGTLFPYEILPIHFCRSRLFRAAIWNSGG